MLLEKEWKSWVIEKPQNKQNAIIRHYVESRDSTSNSIQIARAVNNYAGKNTFIIYRYCIY
jgi:hypothetical protein